MWKRRPPAVGSTNRQLPDTRRVCSSLPFTYSEIARLAASYTPVSWYHSPGCGMIDPALAKVGGAPRGSEG
jgi:hypothetical protein